MRVARRVRRAGRGNPPGAILAGRPGPTQHLRGVLVAVGAGGVHGVLDDPHGDRRPVGLATRVQLGQVAAVGQHRDRGQLERRRGPPQDVRPGGQHVAGQGVAQEVPVGQHEHPRAERRQQVPGQGLLADRVGAERGPDQRPGPRLGRDQPADLRERPIPGGIRRAARSTRRSPSMSGTSVVEPSIDTTRSPQQNTPAAPSAPTGPATCVEQHVQRVGPQPGPRPRQRGDVRRPPPPTRTGLDPAVRVEHPVEQLLAAAAVIQRVHQLDHDPPVAAVRAPEQPQRQHEVDDQPSRQQPTPHLPGVGGRHHPVHQLRRERPGQRPHRHPVGQPPLRRDPRRPVMRHPVIIPGDDHHTGYPRPRRVASPPADPPRPPPSTSR